MSEPSSGTFDFLESSPYAQIAYTFDLRIVAVNDHHCAMTGVPRETLIDRGLFEVFPANPDDPAADAEAPLRASVKRMRETERADIMPLVKHDLERLDEPGVFEERWWQIIHSPLRDADSRVVGALQTTRDVTGDVRDRDVEQARQRSAEAAGKLQFWEYDPITAESTRAPGVDALYGFLPDEIGPDVAVMIDRIHAEDRPAVLTDLDEARTAPIGTTFDTDYRVVWPDGSVHHVNSISELVATNTGRKLTGVLIDTTAIHRREDSLRKLVAEKEALLADVNHRVKNSMQMVSSLLRMEERSASRPEEVQRLRAVSSRVAAVAAVHASLYHHADVSRVNMSDHLSTFCRQLSADHDGRVTLEIEKEPLYLSAERAVPLALIVNELVSHALTAPGPDEAVPVHQVAVKLEYDGPRLLLHVSDDGKRHVTDTGPHGSRLTKALLAQLGGTLKQARSDGSQSSIEFERV